MDTEPNEHIEMALLARASESEACVLESLLEASGIPVQRRYSSVAAVQALYGTSSILGMELYVPESCLQQAKDIIEHVPEAEDNF